MFIRKIWILFWIVVVFIIFMSAFNAGILRGSEPPLVTTVGGNTALVMINYDGSYYLVSKDPSEAKMGCILGTQCQR